MARDGVGQAGAQHDEFVLALALGRADGAADRAVEAPQLALGAAVHIAHAADDGVRLVIEIEAVADELFQLDFGRAFEAAVAAGAAATITAISTVTAISAGAIAARAAISTGAAPAAGSAATAATAFARGTVLFLLLLLFCHV